MLNALRLNDGVPMATFEARTGLSRQAIAGQLDRARANGWLDDDPDWLRPTPLGLRFANDAIVRAAGIAAINRRSRLHGGRQCA